MLFLWESMCSLAKPLTVINVVTSQKICLFYPDQINQILAYHMHSVYWFRLCCTCGNICLMRECCSAYTNPPPNCPTTSLHCPLHCLWLLQVADFWWGILSWDRLYSLLLPYRFKLTYVHVLDQEKWVVITKNMLLWTSFSWSSTLHIGHFILNLYFV